MPKKFKNCILEIERNSISINNIVIVERNVYMSIKKMMLKLAGRDNLQLDSAISTKYLLEECWNYGWMLLRGIRVSFRYPDIKKIIFIDKHVRLREKKKMHIGTKCKIRDHVYIDALSTDGVVLGDNVGLGRETRIECTGSLEYVGKGIRIGDRSTFGSNCFFGAAGGIEIGKDVAAGQYVRFHSENHNYKDITVPIKQQGVTHKGIKVGNNCWIGAGAVFLDGAEIGDGCVVAANTVVTGKFSGNCVIAGVPAKIIKKRV